MDEIVEKKIWVVVNCFPIRRAGNESATLLHTLNHGRRGIPVRAEFRYGEYSFEKGLTVDVYA